MKISKFEKQPKTAKTMERAQKLRSGQVMVVSKNYPGFENIYTCIKRMCNTLYEDSLHDEILDFEISEKRQNRSKLLKSALK